MSRDAVHKTITGQIERDAAGAAPDYSVLDAEEREALKAYAQAKHRMSVRAADRDLGLSQGTVRGAIERGEIEPLMFPAPSGGLKQSVHYRVTPLMLGRWIRDYCTVHTRALPG